jgi:hypothetical protein
MGVEANQKAVPASAIPKAAKRAMVQETAKNAIFQQNFLSWPTKLGWKCLKKK